MTDEKKPKPEKLDVNICVTLTRSDKALFEALAAEVNRKTAQLGRILFLDYIREHMKVKEDEK
jgi:hypothetical protein